MGRAWAGLPGGAAWRRRRAARQLLLRLPRPRPRPLRTARPTRAESARSGMCWPVWAAKRAREWRREAQEELARRGLRPGSACAASEAWRRCGCTRAEVHRPDPSLSCVAPVLAVRGSHAGGSYRALLHRAHVVRQVDASQRGERSATEPCPPRSHGGPPPLSP